MVVVAYHDDVVIKVVVKVKAIVSPEQKPDNAFHMNDFLRSSWCYTSPL
jgi:hypothetical protein